MAFLNESGIITLCKKLLDYFALKSDVNNLTDDISAQLTTKQSTLVSGTNIKTINNESILGSGNINISGSSVTSNLLVTLINYPEEEDWFIADKTPNDVFTALKNGITPVFLYSNVGDIDVDFETFTFISAEKSSEYWDITVSNGHTKFVCYQEVQDINSNIIFSPEVQ